MENGFNIIQYITNPYALTAFAVLVLAILFLKIKAGNRSTEKQVEQGEVTGTNQINISGNNNQTGNISQTIDGDE